MKSPRIESLTGSMILAAGLACCVPVAFDFVRMPLRQLLAVVADDAFFYFQIARNIVASGVPSFDGVNPTNGFHPAWMAVVTLCATFVSDREALLRVALLLCLLLHVLSALLITLILRRTGGRLWGDLGGALWLVNRLPLSLSWLGVEASLYILALCLVAAVFLMRVAPALNSAAPAQPSHSGLALLGIALGAVFLARTESVFLVLVILATVTALILARSGGRLSDLQPWLRVAALAGAFLVVIAPWFVYSYATTGTFLQSSGEMKSLWASDLHGIGGMAGRVRSAAVFLSWHWFGLPVDIMFSVPSPAAGGFPALFLLVLVSLVVVCRRSDRSLFDLTLLLAVSTVLTAAVYGAGYTDYQLWYLAQPAFILFLLFFGWTGVLLRQRRWWGLSESWRSAIAFTCVAVACSVSLRFWSMSPAAYPWQVDVYDSQPHFEKMVPGEARIGCFNNAGIAAYFSDRQVINLDGLVNNAIQAYYRRRDVERYLRDERILFIIDDEPSVRRAMRFMSRPPVLVPLASCPMTGIENGRRWLWRVEDPGERGPRP